MSESRPIPALRSALAEHLPAAATADALTQAGVRVAEWPHVACIVLRGRGDDPGFLSAVQAACGLALPTRPSTFNAAAGLVALWISPDEWWLLAPRSMREGLLGALRKALDGVHAQIADTSGGIALLRLAGPGHALVLRHLSTYDIEALTPGRCVSTQLPKATWTLVRSDDAGVMLLFRRSFAGWIWQLIERSARPYGLAVGTAAQLPCAAFDALLTDTPFTAPGASREHEPVLQP